MEAVSYLGLETVKALVITVNAFATYEVRNIGPVSFEGLWEHSLKVAAAAKKLANAAGATKEIAEESFIAGMLHDIGKLALAANLPEPYAQVYSASNELGLSLHAAEEAAFGVHHGDVGGYLLSLWGLPPRVVNAIILHHEPQRDASREFTPVAAVHIANGFCNERKNGIEADQGLLNVAFLEEIGVAEYISDWRELTQGAM
jgi:putative nucleotidyltransferase with HDIG domain